MIHTILESGDKKNKIGDEFNTLLFSTIFHIKRKKERKKERKKPNTPNWIENGHLEYVKYNSCLQSKIFFKKKKWQKLLKRPLSLEKRKRHLFFLSFAFSKLQKKTHVASSFRVRIAVLVVIWGHFFFLQEIFGFANTKRTIDQAHLT